MINELVSVIIPTYNRYDVLFRAINSVINQDHKNIEIIVVDDNYNNLELRNKIKQKIANDFPSVKLIALEKHLGGALARNVGVENASGEFLAFLDDDDEYVINKISKQLDLFFKSKDDRLALVYCYGDIIYPGGLVEKEETDFAGWPIDVQMTYNIAGTSFWMIKKSILKEIGGFYPIASHQDGVVLLNLLSKGYKVDLIRESLVNYYAHGSTSGITGVTEKNIKADDEYFSLCKNYFYMITKKQQKKVEFNYYLNRMIDLLRIDKEKDANDTKSEYNKKSKNIFRLLKINSIWLFRKSYIKKIIAKDNKYEG